MILLGFAMNTFFACNETQFRDLSTHLKAFLNKHRFRWKVQRNLRDRT